MRNLQASTKTAIKTLLGLMFIALAVPAFAQQRGNPGGPTVVETTWDDPRFQQLFRLERQAPEGAFDTGSYIWVRGLVSCETLGRNLTLSACLGKALQKAELMAEESCLAKGQTNVITTTLADRDRPLILKVNFSQAGAASKYVARATAVKYCSR